MLSSATCGHLFLCPLLQLGMMLTGEMAPSWGDSGFRPSAGGQPFLPGEKK